MFDRNGDHDRPVRAVDGYPVCPEDGAHPREGLHYVKRVIGLPGDEVTYRSKTLYINGKEVPQTDVGPFTDSSDEGT